MLRRSLPFVLIPLLIAGTPTTAPDDPPMLREARRILANVKDTHYTHPTKVDETAGVYHCDCSGFVAYCMRRVAPEAYKVVPHREGKRPLAVDFYRAFVAAGIGEDAPLRRVVTLDDARPGDILAWRRVELVPGDDTGHVLVLDAQPVPEGDGVYRVAVIDSTGSPHGEDTRKPGESGVGRGVMWLKADETGKPLGFRWRSRGGRFTELPIAIGRAH